MPQSDFHVVTVGWGAPLVEGMLDRVQVRTSIRFTHIVVAARQLSEFKSRPNSSEVICLRYDVATTMPPPDRELLESLVGNGISSIANMILSDRVVRKLEYEEALGYATFLARRLREEFERLKPSVVIGGFDGVHAGIGLAVARQLGIPWFAMYFTTLPQGYCSFCTGLTPDTVIAVCDRPDAEVRRIAEITIDEFRARKLVVNAYISTDNLSMMVRRLPKHAGVFAAALKRTISGRFDRFTEFPITRLCKEYVRKRTNAARLPRKWFIDNPPAEPFVFFGLQMQPESSLDTWAPFFTNQVNVVEIVARSLPATHSLLVKLHKSDGDNWSPRQLRQLLRIPGVKLVIPSAQSRTFVEHADAVVAIQGTMAIEAALLEKPVLMFGDSPVQDLPGVRRIGPLSQLPALIREALAAKPPGREVLVRGFMDYLKLYGPGCYYDWERLLSDGEIDNLAGQFEALRQKLAGERRVAVNV